MPEFCAPLDSDLWFRRIELIAEGRLDSMEASLRHASHLLQMTPAGLRHVFYLSVDSDAFEALLEADQLDEAAKTIVARPTGLLVDEANEGRVRAMLSCPILKRTIEGRGATVAAATLDAWTRCLLTIEKELGSTLFQAPSQPENKSQSGRGRRSSLH